MEIVLDQLAAIPKNDEQLIRRIAAGDEAALQAMFAAYGQRLYAFAYRLVGDADGAEEVVQDTLVAAWQGAGRFRGEGRALTWLLGIVHHKALNKLRGRTTLPLEAHEDTLPASGPLPDDLAARGEQRRLVRAGLDSLSLEHRTVIELVFYQGLSLNEVAQVTGCPLGTVKSRLSYAKNCLRGYLNREGFAPEDVG